MKRILLILSLVFFTSCNDKASDEAPTEPSHQPKTHTISFGMLGEIYIENTPLSKTNLDDLYGIQVWSKIVESTDDYVACAYGLFNDKSKMSINLLEGYLYKFQATMIVDGRNIIYIDSWGGFSYPFQMAQGIQLENKFIWSSYNMNAIGSGKTMLNNVKTHNRPFTDRYYGETVDYIPVENGSVGLDMKRTVFGVKFITDNLVEGELIIDMEDSPQLALSNECTDVERLVTFSRVNSAWATDDYTESIPISITWKKADGVVFPLLNKTVIFTRKQLSIITVKVNDSEVDGRMDLTLEQGGLAVGDDVVFDGDDWINTVVF